MNAVVETRGLCKQYGPALRVNHLDLTVPEGAVYGFLGPNGAGKSTTLKLLLGLARPTAGEIAVFGRPMGPRTRMETLRQVGMPHRTFRFAVFHFQVRDSGAQFRIPVYQAFATVNQVFFIQTNEKNS